MYSTEVLYDWFPFFLFIIFSIQTSWLFIFFYLFSWWYMDTLGTSTQWEYPSGNYHEFPVNGKTIHFFLEM